MKIKSKNNFCSFLGKLCTNNRDDFYSNTDSYYSSDVNITDSPKIQSNNNSKTENRLILPKEQTPQKTFNEAFTELNDTFQNFENNMDNKIKNSNFNFKDFLYEKMNILSIENPRKNFLQTAKIIEHTHKKCTNNKNKQNNKEVFPIDYISDSETSGSSSNKNLNSINNINLRSDFQIETNLRKDEIETNQKKEITLLGNKRKLDTNNKKIEIIYNEIDRIYGEIKYLKEKEFYDKEIPDDGNDKIYEKDTGYYSKNKTIIVDGINIAVIYFVKGRINKVFMCQEALMLEDKTMMENYLINIKDRITERLNKIKSNIQEKE